MQEPQNNFLAPPLHAATAFGWVAVWFLDIPKPETLGGVSGFGVL